MKARPMMIVLCMAQMLLFVFLLFTVPEPAGHLKAARKTVQGLAGAEVSGDFETVDRNVAAALRGYRALAIICLGSAFVTASIIALFLGANKERQGAAVSQTLIQ